MCECNWMGCTEVKNFNFKQSFSLLFFIKNCELVCSRARYAHKILPNTATHVMTLFGSSQFITRSHLRSQFSTLLSHQAHPFTKQINLYVAVILSINWFKNKPLGVLRFVVLRTFIKKLFISN